MPRFIYRFLEKESHGASLHQIQQAFLDVILSKDDRDRVIQLALTTRNTKKSNAPYRHVLLHGPPGTGKTMIARKLAECSGMDYAILSGGDVGPLGEEAVDQVRLFQFTIYFIWRFPTIQMHMINKYFLFYSFVLATRSLSMGSQMPERSFNLHR
jgi:hypothetical protein